MYLNVEIVFCPTADDHMPEDRECARRRVHDHGFFFFLACLFLSLNLQQTLNCAVLHSNNWKQNNIYLYKNNNNKRWHFLTNWNTKTLIRQKEN